MEAPHFWDDSDRAQKIVKQLRHIETPLNQLHDLEQGLEDARLLLGMSIAEDDAASFAEIVQEVERLTQAINQLELQVLLSGRYDDHDAIVSLHAGAGGTESQDWVSILYRMYSRFLEAKGFKIHTLDFLPGEEAGIKSVTFEVAGDNAYGYLYPEKGVHRLVRISPFDASGRRHTSFASMDVLPQIADAGELSVSSDELRVDTYRASGAGGQHINKTDSAVRITHLPTGIVVACQTERSQHANRENAMKMLLAKLADRREQDRLKEIGELRGEQGDIAWGNQIRSYVFQPYTMVKDHRTGHESGNVQNVIDGDLMPFIEAFLRQKAQSGLKAT